jgi:hypothetical protein
LISDQEYTNKLADWLIPELSKQQKKRLLDVVSDFPSRATKLNISDIVNECGAAVLIDRDEVGQVVEFLVQRVSHVPSIGTKQAGLPRLL